MTTIEIHVPAVPVAQPRQRHRIVKAKNGGQFVSNYTPAKDPVNAFKASVRMAASQVYTGPPLQGPLRVDLDLVFPRPKSLTWKRRAMPRLPHTSKPDADNAFKSLADSLNGLLWADDAQIAETTIRKFVASGDEQPHVLIRVTLLELTAV